VERLESPVPGLTALDRGVLVHDVFRRIWNVLGSHARFIVQDEESLRHLIREEVRSALDAMAPERRVLKHSRFAAIERARLEKLATEWLELEKRRQAFVVVEQEQERQVAVGGIEFKTRVDRIDRLEDGTYVVLDYKTADSKISGWAGPRPDEPQVPLYAITADVPLSGVLFGIAKLGEIGFRGSTRTEDIVPKPKPRAGDPPLEELIENWRSVMTELATDFRAGKATVDPKDHEKTCRYCGLHAVCRIREAPGDRP
jgi:ATP-dependent helicase/DNAse subunit B